MLFRSRGILSERGTYATTNLMDVITKDSECVGTFFSAEITALGTVVSGRNRRQMFSLKTLKRENIPFEENSLDYAHCNSLSILFFYFLYYRRTPVVTRHCRLFPPRPLFHLIVMMHSQIAPHLMWLDVTLNFKINKNHQFIFGFF